MGAKTPYAVGLAGERSYQAQIAAVGVGEAVVLVHEPDNPYDERAIAATCHGDTIGYVPRDSWLTAALLDEVKGCSATIKRLQRGSEGITGVTLQVRLDGKPIGERDYAPA
ncbi:HIRAN domain-containing protein [Qipengyuania sp.]|uniref:HIRAN domain-containing protein n=1 Tax=Qipengyuania sp. TaxID=2004515 RepID=UPI003513E03B